MGSVMAGFDEVDGEADLVLASGQGKWAVAACMAMEHVVGCARLASARFPLPLLRPFALSPSCVGVGACDSHLLSWTGLT